MNILRRIKNSLQVRGGAVVERIFKNSSYVHAHKPRKAWKTRNSQESLESYFNDQNAAHRKVILEIVRTLDPKVVYEYGCYSAPTLRLLSEHLPDCEMYGTDINLPAIEFVSPKLPRIKFARADDSSFVFLDKWLPEVIDVSIVSSVFYSMSTSQVVKTLEFLSKKSKFLLIGCNMTNYEGQRARIEKDNIVHPYRKIFSELGLIECSRFASNVQDVSLTEFLLLKLE